MTKHDPNRIHWNKIFRILNENEGSMAIYDLAEELKLEKNNPFLESAVEQLVNQGRCKITMGKSRNGLLCRVLQIVEKDKSKREQV